MKTLAERLRYARGDMSMNELSRLAAVSSATISRVEDGTQRTMKYELAQKIAKVTGVDSHWLVVGDGRSTVTVVEPVVDGMAELRDAMRELASVSERLLAYVATLPRP